MLRFVGLPRLAAAQGTFKSFVRTHYHFGHRTRRANPIKLGLITVYMIGFSGVFLYLQSDLSNENAADAMAEGEKPVILNPSVGTEKASSGEGFASTPPPPLDDFAEQHRLTAEAERGFVVKPTEALDVGCRIVQSLCRLVIFISCYCLLRTESDFIPLFRHHGADCLAQRLLKIVEDESLPSVPLLMALFIVPAVVLLASSARLCGSYAQAKEVLLYTTLLLALSPVIRSLAETVSTDTVYALSALLSALHLLVADYSPPKKRNEASVARGGSSNGPANRNGNGIPQEEAPSSSGVSVSLNSQILSSVCLASRLDSNGAVFCLMCAAALLFVVATDVSKAVLWQRLLTLLHISGATFALVALGPPAAVLAVWTGSLIAVGILLPLLFVQLQNLKQVASGPWDEAVPTIAGGLPFA